MRLQIAELTKEQTLKLFVLVRNVHHTKVVTGKGIGEIKDKEVGKNLETLNTSKNEKYKST